MGKKGWVGGMNKKRKDCLSTGVECDAEIEGVVECDDITLPHREVREPRLCRALGGDLERALRNVNDRHLGGAWGNPNQTPWYWDQHNINLNCLGANLSPTWAQHEPTWSQLGPNLDPT